MKVLRRVLDFAIQASRNNHPREFAGLFRARDDTITEIILIPGTTWNERSATLPIHNLPIDPSIVGSIHSHPGSPIPSKADLDFFSRFGRIHAIVGFPYDYSTIAFFLPSGERTSIDVVDDDTLGD